jgi:putative NADPH-quinone reductase
MSKNIVIIQGHPDASKQHFGHAFSEAYEKGAHEGGHNVKTIVVAALEFPLLRSAEDFYEHEPLSIIQQCQADIRWADHLVIVYPLWMGSMPALLKGFIEQVFRPGFAMQPEKKGTKWRQLLKGKSAHIIVTMGMPALVYRWFFGAHSLKSLERNILRFTGITPIKESLVGNVEGNTKHRQRWLEKLHALGKAAR